MWHATGSEAWRATAAGVPVLCRADPWAWWAAQEGGYAGLPVNVLAQITGDLVLMGLLIPVVRLAEPGCADNTAPVPSHGHSLVTARRCVQLLGSPTLLRQLCTDGSAALVHDLRAALENDIRVEILLPDPTGQAGHAAAGRLGLEPGGYGRCLERLLDELGTGMAQAQWRGLDLALSRSRRCLLHPVRQEHLGVDAPEQPGDHARLLRARPTLRHGCVLPGLL